MKIDKDVISRVAVLARIDLTDGEKAEFSEQLSRIIGYVEKINELDTENIIPADHIGGVKNILRDDIEGETIGDGVFERMSPKFENGHIVVPRIIEGS